GAGPQSIQTVDQRGRPAVTARPVRYPRAAPSSPISAPAEPTKTTLPRGLPLAKTGRNKGAVAPLGDIRGPAPPVALRASGRSRLRGPWDPARRRSSPSR